MVLSCCYDKVWARTLHDQGLLIFAMITQAWCPKPVCMLGEHFAEHAEQMFLLSVSMFVCVCIRERDCMCRHICIFMGACVGVYVGVRELIACLHVYVCT
jgi:hypothetical protein